MNHRVRIPINFSRRWRGSATPYERRLPGPLGPVYIPRPLTRPGRGINQYDPMDRADSAGRVRRTRPTATRELTVDTLFPSRENGSAAATGVFAQIRPIAAAM